MQMRNLVLIALLAISSVQVVRADALVATGSAGAAIRDGRKLDAREQALTAALDDAITKAVAKVIGKELDAWSDEQRDVVESKLVPNRKQYQDSFEILLDEVDEESGRYRVRARVSYNEEKLRSALTELGVFRQKRTWQRIMVMIPEQHLTRIVPDPAAETDIIRQFVEAGYRVIDQRQIAKIRYNEQSRLAARGDNAAAAAIGRQFGAEIVIIGEAFSQFASQVPGGMVNCRARVEARILQTDNGEVLAAHGLQGSGIDATEEMAGKKALSNTGGMVAKYFLEQLDKRAKRSKGETKIVELVVLDIPYEPYVHLKSVMKEEIRGVEDFHERNYEAKRAEIEVEYSAGDAQALAASLATMKLNGFRLKILTTSPNKIEMSASPGR
jgi:hypothetical protein